LNLVCFVYISPQISFLDNVQWFLLCEKTLNPEELTMFSDAIEDDYYFEMFIEDLPMWGYIGEVEGEELLLGHIETARRYALSRQTWTNKQ